MLRKLVNKLNRKLTNSMVPSRRRYAASIKVWFDPDTSSEQARERARSSFIIGETVDISRTGVAFLVPSIRINEKYLVGHERPLNVEIDLPTGRVEIRLIGKRYEKVGVHVSTERFLVGAQIVDLRGPDKDAYELFLRKGNRSSRTSTASLELGIDR